MTKRGEKGKGNAHIREHAQVPVDKTGIIITVNEWELLGRINLLANQNGALIGTIDRLHQENRAMESRLSGIHDRENQIINGLKDKIRKLRIQVVKLRRRKNI